MSCDIKTSVVQDEPALPSPPPGVGEPDTETDTEVKRETDGGSVDTETYPEGVLKAWLNMLGAFCAMACTFGWISTFGVFQAYYHTHLLKENTHSQIAWIGGLQAFFICTTGLISGPLVDRYGLKIAYTNPLFAPGSAISDDHLRGFSVGMLYTPSISIMGHYFHRRRDLAIAVASAGSPLGGVIFPIALLQMLEHSSIGFGWDVRGVGLIFLFFLCIACATLTSRVTPRRGPHFLSAAFRDPVYVSQLVGYCLVFWGIYTPFFFLPSFAILQSVSVDWAFYILPIYNTGSFVGRIVCGRLITICGRFNTLLAAILVSAVLMFTWLAATSLAGIIVFAVLFGFSSGAIIGLFPAAVAVTAPRANQIGTYLGMTMGVLGLFCLTSSPMMGAIVTRSGGRYDEAVIFSAVLIAVGGSLIVFARVKHSGWKLVA
ncbi:MFS monocarboxylate transporter [Trichophyton equinum CBS 127.97]|uniref:MFS monocarboxylate transporter n=1 Tax=Trichophyton equinum (strain ATCC MYA-4606 / CBS 127.97) TaxID=559882 RepID=F2PUE4_TRIEC|nr:MFS monocarboxylate transporter [Trichophyton equinum CBS 127.97]